MTDSFYFILLLGCMALAAWAQASIRSAYSKYSQVRSRCGLTAEQLARQLMQNEGLSQLSIQYVPGQLTDHYNPKTQTLALSTDDAHSDSIAALAVSAHEMGHAMQHRDSYGPLALRSLIAPAVQIGSGLAGPLILLGFVMSLAPLVDVGILLYAGITLFTLVTLPVEFNASRRAMTALEQGGYLTGEELTGARKVLTAAAMTYVASALTSLVQTLRLVAMRRRRS